MEDNKGYGILGIVAIVAIVGLVVMFSGKETTKYIMGEKIAPTLNSPTIVEERVTGMENIAGAATWWEWFVRGCTGQCAIPNCESKTISRTKVRNASSCYVFDDWADMSCAGLITQTNITLPWGFDNDCRCYRNLTGYPAKTEQNQMFCGGGQNAINNYCTRNGFTGTRTNITGCDPLRPTDKCGYCGTLATCTVGYLNNYRCSGNYRQREYQDPYCSKTWVNIQYCPYGCNNGFCLSQPSFCIDSDGSNINNKGFVNSTDGITYDFCINTTRVAEQLCSGTMHINTSFACTNNSCSSGMCLI